MYFFRLLLPLFLLFGCNTKDKEPPAIFSQIKDKALKTSGRTLHWKSAEEMLAQKSYDDLLKKELTEEAAVEIAMLNNPTLQTEYERIGIVSAEFKQASLLKNPFFMFNYQFTTSSEQPSQMNVNFVESFLEILLIPLKRRAAEKQIDILKSEILEKVITVIAKTRIHFHNMQVNYEILEVYKKILYAKELAYEGAMMLRLAGNITELKLTEKHHSYERAKLDVENAKIAFLESKEVVNNLLGLWGNKLGWDFCKKKPEIKDDEKKYLNMENIAIASNLSLKRSFAEIKKQAALLKVDTSKTVFQDISLGLSGQYQDNIWFLGPEVDISVPIFDIGHVKSVKARAEISFLWKKFIKQAISIRTTVRKGRIEYINTYKQAKIVKEKLLPLAKKHLAETILQHNAMQLGVFAVLDAKESQLKKEILFLEKEKNFFSYKMFMKALEEGSLLKGELF